MSYRSGVEKIQEIVIQNLKENKKAVILFYNSNNDKYFEVKEYIGIVTKVIERGQKGEISKLEVMFAENKKAQTNVFIDDSIVEGSLISLIGYFIDYGNFGTVFTAKGGVNEVLTTLKDTYLASKLNVNKIYKTGIIFELSKMEFPKEYTREVKINKIDGLSNFYYTEELVSQQNIEEKINSVLKNIGYVRNDPSVISNVENEEEDFVDIDEE